MWSSICCPTLSSPQAKLVCSALLANGWVPTFPIRRSHQRYLRPRLVASSARQASFTSSWSASAFFFAARYCLATSLSSIARSLSFVQIWLYCCKIKHFKPEWHRPTVFALILRYIAWSRFEQRVHSSPTLRTLSISAHYRVFLLKFWMIRHTLRSLQKCPWSLSLA